jgi:hypothetical protein
MNCVFLGDSLTEGVGKKRISYVSELVTQVRAKFNAHELRLRQIDLDGFIDFNVAGKMNIDDKQNSSDLWFWNLACEGKTIETDLAWVPLISTIKPELVVIFRGSLESIIRPATLPSWVPGSWRGYAAMDPRCYFSTTWWRKAKQQTIDAAKQRVRLNQLSRSAGKPLMDCETIAEHLTTLLRRLNTRVLILGLLPLDEARFPGSPAHFKAVNAKLEEIANAERAEFFDWGSRLGAQRDLFYRDGFHPNLAGARALAEILRTRLFDE